MNVGDIFYQTIRPEEHFNQCSGDSGLLEIEDIPTECNLFSRHFKISEDGCENCLINHTDITKSLHKICQQTENCDGIILMGNQCGAYGSSLIYHNGRIYTFDPHSLSPTTGMPCANGTSVLLTFDSISKFAEYLLHCASNHNAEQLTLWKVIVARMQQLECRDANFENGEHQNANLKLHTGKLQSNTVHSKVKDDYTKNSTFRKCEQTKNEHIEHSQQIESEQEVALICEICSKTLDNLYNLNLHKEKCKEKRIFICKICSKQLDNLHNLNEHERKCKKKYNEIKITYKCSICSKVLDNKSNLLQHETKCKKKYHETKITYKCSICSKVLDNKSNLLQHETKYKKKHHKAVKDRKKKN